jgi:hypothetical protein
MAQSSENTLLVNAAKSIGKVAGSIARVAGGSSQSGRQQLPANVWEATYIGSGTFIIHKPKRSRRKLHQSRVKNRPRGARA